MFTSRDGCGMLSSSVTCLSTMEAMIVPSEWVSVEVYSIRELMTMSRQTWAKGVSQNLWYSAEAPGERDKFLSTVFSPVALS